MKGEWVREKGYEKERERTCVGRIGNEELEIGKK